MQRCDVVDAAPWRELLVVVAGGAEVYGAVRSQRGWSASTAGGLPSRCQQPRARLRLPAVQHRQITQLDTRLVCSTLLSTVVSTAVCVDSTRLPHLWCRKHKDFGQSSGVGSTVKLLRKHDVIDGTARWSTVQHRQAPRIARTSSRGCHELGGVSICGHAGAKSRGNCMILYCTGGRSYRFRDTVGSTVRGRTVHNRNWRGRVEWMAVELQTHVL